MKKVMPIIKTSKMLKLTRRVREHSKAPHLCAGVRDKLKGRQSRVSKCVKVKSMSQLTLSLSIFSPLIATTESTTLLEAQTRHTIFLPFLLRKLEFQLESGGPLSDHSTTQHNITQVLVQ